MSDELNGTFKYLNRSVVNMKQVKHRNEQVDSDLRYLKAAANEFYREVEGLKLYTRSEMENVITQLVHLEQQVNGMKTNFFLMLGLNILLFIYMVVNA